MGLITPRRNPLAFPGGRPGVNPGHLALRSGGLRCSVVAAGGGAVTNLLNPKPLSSLLGSGAQVSSVSSFGPVVDFPQGTNGNIFVPGVVETPKGITWALIFSIDASHSPGANPVLFTNNGAVPSGSCDCLFFTGSTLYPSVLVAGGAGSWTVPMPVGVPLFLAVSYTVSGAVSVGANVLRNLVTGQTWSIADTGGASAIQANTTGVYGIGNGGAPGSPGTNYTSCSKIAAAAFIANALSVNELLEWAKAPWDFWYPQAISKQMLSLSTFSSPPSGVRPRMLPLLGVG